MKILIIGATRGIGKALLDCALEGDHQVRVLAREPSKITRSHPRLEVVGGDIRDAAAVQRAVRGQQAVCSCIGSPITFAPVDLFSVGARNLVEAMRHDPGQKLVAVTGIGAGDSKGHGGFLYDRIFKPLLLKTIYQDKDREEEI
ncbi:MAG: NAD(P)H-binding protein, partial [Desulfofustis sp.]|nr:NAD(P)H-binding protein [Desulfofustis sp.]